MKKPSIMKQPPTNTNCLQGIRCPKCGSEDRFTINVNADAIVTDDGTESFEDATWDDSSFICCRSCYHDATVKEFTVNPKSEE